MIRSSTGRREGVAHLVIPNGRGKLVWSRWSAVRQRGVYTLRCLLTLPRQGNPVNAR